MKKVLVASFVLAMTVTGLAQKSSLAPDLQSLVDTERAFARTATEKGVRDSFLDLISDDGVLYRPGPVNGREWLKARPARPGLLTWQPTFAEISAAGDMGITTGPWEFREKDSQDPPIGFGQFATVWKKQADGKWKFVIDIGIQHEKPTTSAIPWTLPADFKRNKVITNGDMFGLKSKLLSVDENFSKVSAAKGALKAYNEFGADGIRLLRNGSFPIKGKNEVSVVLAAKPGSISWQPVKADVASSGDLGYTYGNYEFKRSRTEAKAETETGYYLRVWKRQSNGGWRVVLEVFNEFDKPA